jgi:hypothetical protein
MKKAEAIEQLKKGKKLTHRYFSFDEWMVLNGLVLTFEDGVKITLDEFFRDRLGNGWEDGYSIFE